MKSKTENFLNSFFAITRIGSGRKLFIFDVIVWIVILYDLYKINNLNLDIYHFSFVQNIWENFSFYYVGITILIIYLPPLINALIDFLFKELSVLKRTIPTKFKNTVFIFHLISAIAFSFFISISNELQQLSGYKTNNVDFTLNSYEFTPTYYLFFTIVTGTSAIGILVKLIALLIGRSNLSAEWKLWFNLADISKEYFPKQKANLIFVNTASMAPTINWINAKEESYRNKYQNMVPTSDDAKEFLKGTANKSRDFIREYLFQDSSNKSNFSIEFLPGTSRGLEVGLSQIKDIDKIILSPYEHPSQYNVVEWFANLKKDIRHTQLEMDHSMLVKNWEEQKKWLIELIKSELVNEGDKKVAVLISEVHYISGLYINIQEIIEALRPTYENSKIVFIIDGSQSVGNILKPFNNLIGCLRGEDFYYFSAHKWLLSPNTCGVLIAEQLSYRYEINPYDLFGAELPTASIEPGVIFGLYSSLQYLIGNNMFHLKKFQEKSKSLKTFFKENIGDQFEIIESSAEEMNLSSFIALRPSNRHEWKDEDKKEFWKAIRKAGVDLTLIDLTETNEETWWLRISFPYFLQIHAVKQLINHLKKRVKSIN